MKFIVLLLALLATATTFAQSPGRGETLSKIHCASCHAYPEPALLDKTSWEKHILPRMGQMLGVLPLTVENQNFVEREVFDLVFQNPLVFRKKTPLSAADWAAIQDFYLQNAPEKMEAPKLVVEQNLPQFEVRFPDYFLSPPSTTMVKILDEQLFVGDANSKRLYHFGADLTLKRNASVGEGAISFNRLPDGDVVTTMGSFSPTDIASGQVLFLPNRSGQLPRILIDSLKRPVHTAAVDLDGDGLFDLVVCEFAKWTGSLCWWKNEGDGYFSRKMLRDMPGAIRTEIRDFDGDGRPDIMALFGQGDEGIFIFYNRGDGQFEERRALQFPPSYGSSFFQLFDYDGDAHPDIIYTCGDNADFPPIYKPYHGIRIFQNDGKNQFDEVFFYPLPGAYSAIPHDFDLDGDLDIAAISFFPDFKNTPEQAFVFLENQGNQQFKTHTFPAVNKGRWIVMDAGDLDGDGDWDLVLGALTMETVPETTLLAQWVRDGIPFVVLQNKAR